MTMAVDFGRITNKTVFSKWIKLGSNLIGQGIIANLRSSYIYMQIIMQNGFLGAVSIIIIVPFGMPQVLTFTKICVF